MALDVPYRRRQPTPPTGTTTTTTVPGGAGSLDQQIADLANEAAAAGGGARQYIGVGPDYTTEAPRAMGGTPYGARGGYDPGRPTTGMVGPRYFVDDEYAPANYKANVISDMQRKMAAIGLFDTNATVIPGDWGEETATAFRRLLAYSNQHGVHWRIALSNLTAQAQGLAQSSGGGPGGRLKIDEFGNLVPIGTPAAREPLVTRTTDPRTLELVLRETAMNLTGQALSPDQVQGMSAAYNQMEVQRQQAAYDAQVAGGSVLDIPSPEAFAQSEIETQHPGETQSYRGLTYLQDAMSMLASPAWGIGR